MRNLILCLSLALFAIGAQAETKLTQEETQNFMTVVDGLQGWLYAAKDHLKNEKGVRDFREIADVLALHQRTVNALNPRDRRDSFAGFLVNANPWVNRNLGIADDLEGGGSAFAAMFDVLNKHTDAEIAANPKLQEPLDLAASRIQGASGLESMGVGPRAVTLTNGELDVAVAIAALGVVYLPSSIVSTNEYYATQQVVALKWLSGFLQQKEAHGVLNKRATSSLIAAIALGILDNRTFVTTLDKTAALVEKKPSRDDLTVSDRGRFENYTAVLKGIAGLTREETEAAFKPASKPKIGAGPSEWEVEPPFVSGNFTREDAETVMATSLALAYGLRTLNDAIKPDTQDLLNDPNYLALHNSVATLRLLWEDLASNSNNLGHHLMEFSHSDTRNFMLLGIAARGEDSPFKLLQKTVQSKNLVAVEKSIRDIENVLLLQNGTPGASDEFSNDSVTTQSRVAGLIGISTQAIPASLLNQTQDAEHVRVSIGLLRHIMKLAAIRKERIGSMADRLRIEYPNAPETKPFVTTAKLLLHYKYVQSRLGELETNAAILKGTEFDVSPPMQLDQITRELYLLMTTPPKAKNCAEEAIH